MIICKCYRRYKMNPVKLYLLHFSNINKLFDTCQDKKAELASRVPGCAKIKNRFLLNCLWWIMVVIEPFMSLLLVTIYFFVFSYKIVTRGKTLEVGEHLGLCYSGLARQRIKAVGEVYDKVDYYLYPIFVDTSWLMKDKEPHNVLEKVSFWEVVKAYLWSWPCIIAATIKTHGKYLYRNHLSYEYLLTDYYFKRIPIDSTLYFVNHLDRWAVLFNIAPQTNKVLLQHGIETPTADWPVKLTNVNKAFVFSDNQKERIVKAVLGHDVDFTVMPHTITLTEMQSTLKKNIVIVAYPNYLRYEQEEFIIKSLSNLECRIFVKIHPGKNDFQKYEELRRTVNPYVEVISTPTFPKVGLVVSYYSTLGIEYEAYNLPVFYYEEMGMEEIVGRIKEYIFEDKV